MVKRIRICPSVEDVRSGKVVKPERIMVNTVLAAMRDRERPLEIKSFWKMDYEPEILQFLSGILATPFHVEIVMPYDIPHGHKRAACRVAAAAIGLQRFRRPIRMYPTLENEMLCVAKVGRKNILFINEIDAKFWARNKGHKKAKIKVLTIGEAKQSFYPDLTDEELMDIVQENSLRAREFIYRLTTWARRCTPANKEILYLMEEFGKEYYGRIRKDLIRREEAAEISSQELY
jgi:hypothetical protein